ncbi:membrane protein insertase YidC [Mycoplasma sp. 744]|uniref:membrane protein insertase YidC n=1 Tax=Mycoplasma sp. 744 TaxID=3108531 RepID=UPI002B1D034B|nr:membrane protein insertase YidC [Mycoplasma sp. 744]MEA4115255.1 membrane protein insertase YidC [Mycoplasma sp. 744]
MEKNRSKHFDYFSKNNTNNNPNKTTWKRVWFWIKTILYVLIFGITFTGCIQTWVVKTSTYSGAGTEFYLNKNEIAPSIRTITNGDIPKNDKFLKENEFYEVKHLTEANYLLSKYSDPTTLEEIQKQTAEDNGEYGKYNSFSSGIQFIDKNQQNDTQHAIIYNEETKRYLFKAISSQNYKSIYPKLTTIKFLNPEYNLNNFFTLNQNDKTYTLITNSDTPYTKETFKWDKDKNSFSTTEKFVYSKASLFEVENNFNNKANLTFNRDVLELLYNKTFDENNNTYYANAIKDFDIEGSTITEKYQNILNKIIDHKENLTLTEEQFNAIFMYNETILKYLRDLNFLTVEVKDKVHVLDLNNNLAFDNNNNPVYLDKVNPSNYKAGNYLNDINSLAYQNTIEQKPITSWVESWNLGPFFSLFVYPISYITSSIRNPLPNAFGWTTIFAIIIAVVVTRLIALAFTWKATVTQSRQEELKHKKAKIDAKYAEFKHDKQMKARQQQEIQTLYKKHGINPFDIILSTFISLPIFLAMWRVIQSVPSLKSTTWLGFEFSATSWRNLIYEGQFQYIALLIVTLSTQLISQILPRILNRRKNKQRLSIEEEKALKKSNKTQNIMLIVFTIISVLFTAGVQIYWIFSSLWMIIQTLIIHYVRKSEFYRKKYLNKAL